MSEGDPPTRESLRPESAKDTRATYGVAVLLFLIGIAAMGSWFLGPNALGQDSNSHEGRDNALYFMLFGPIGIPLGIYFVYLARTGAKRSKTLAEGQRVDGTITHLWKLKDEPPEKRYRVGYSAPGVEPAFFCVTAQKFKKLSVGETIPVVVAGAASYPEL